MLLVPDLNIALVLAFAEAKSATNQTEPSAIFALNVRWIQASRGSHRGDMVCDLLRRACWYVFINISLSLFDIFDNADLALALQFIGPSLLRASCTPS
ncbi:hypothetical protein CYLTODRAFT_457655 [Cylindrobasidium torrendii FP15055 ss-10]|uniref:Uncharacterized protein n=1 Tax=Cylindrobasidium torrendii FP15055 ss-10 TaxID=1314674 RepID=A0A0D7B1A9_9AGAR|nr:hypothetical protein CYLTODRAFT_457655 [Cylindrobasidium torrendii FP15055 ss-10]